MVLPFEVSPPLPSKGETSVNLSVPIDSAINGAKNSLKAPGLFLSPIIALKQLYLRCLDLIHLYHKH
jgi:hypothetical protein